MRPLLALHVSIAQCSQIRLVALWCGWRQIIQGSGVNSAYGNAHRWLRRRVSHCHESIGAFETSVRLDPFDFGLTLVSWMVFWLSYKCHFLNVACHASVKSRGGQERAYPMSWKGPRLATSHNVNTSDGSCGMPLVVDCRVIFLTGSCHMWFVVPNQLRCH